MTEKDDLFEFGGLEEPDSLEFDINELFEDLATLSIDVDSVDVGVAPAPVMPPDEAPPLAADQPVAAGDEPQPDPETSAAAPIVPQPTAQEGVQPVAPQPQPVAQPVQVAGAPVQAAQMAQAAPLPAGQPAAFKLQRSNVVMVIAALVTGINLAAIGLPMLGSSDEPRERVAVERPLDGETGSKTAAVDPALLERIAQLEAQLYGMDSPEAHLIPNSGERHRAFDEVERSLSEGDYLAARQRLYSLLAIVDRFAKNERDRIEALASYLLADTYKLELQLDESRDASEALATLVDPEVQL